MDYLQYKIWKNNYHVMDTIVLNLIINGLPSILEQTF